MFSWIDMIGTYEKRNIANFKSDNFEVDTSLVNDRPIPYETAIKHKDFRDNEWIVLGWRDTPEEAEKFHNEVVAFYEAKDKEIGEITDVYENCTFKRQGAE